MFPARFDDVPPAPKRRWRPTAYSEPHPNQGIYKEDRIARERRTPRLLGPNDCCGAAVALFGLPGTRLSTARSLSAQEPTVSGFLLMRESTSGSAVMIRELVRAVRSPPERTCTLADTTDLSNTLLILSCYVHCCFVRVKWLLCRQEAAGSDPWLFRRHHGDGQTQRLACSLPAWSPGLPGTIRPRCWEDGKQAMQEESIGWGGGICRFSLMT